MLTPDRFSAVVITRGDVDLTPVLESLIFDDVVVWDNSVRENEMTHARIVATNFTRHQFIYSQDDDIIHTPDNQRRIVEAFEPGTIVGCMWPEWSQGAKDQGIPNGYDDLVFPGSGSVYHRAVPIMAASKYLDWFPEDDFFRLWCDTIVGTIAPSKQLDIRFEALPCAEDDNRMCNLPDAVEMKAEAIRRATWIRDEQYVRAIA